MRIPKDWSEVTYAQYKRIQELKQLKLEDKITDEDYVLETYAAFLSIKPEKVLNISESDITTIDLKLEEVLMSPIPLQDSMIIRVYLGVYAINMDVNKIEISKLSELVTLLEKDIDLDNDIELILSFFIKKLKPFNALNVKGLLTLGFQPDSNDLRLKDKIITNFDKFDMVGINTVLQLFNQVKVNYKNRIKDAIQKA